MKPADKIEKLVRKFEVGTNAEKDKAVLDSLLSAQARCKCGTPGFIWRVVVKGGIIAVAAGVVIMLAIKLPGMGGENVISHPAGGGETVTVRHPSLSELTSVMSLNAVFRDGGMEAVEKRFDEVEKRIKPGLKESITINQLMCELDDCKEIQKKGTL
jgi:hypothetical protein